MACCALKKQKKQLLIIPLILFLFTTVLGAFFVSILSIPGLFSARIRLKRNKSVNFFKDLLTGLSQKILYEPFLFDSVYRSKLSGKLMSISSRMAGKTYKYFNLILLGSIIIFTVVIIKIVKLIIA